jgi:AcrR family transcriptional regulator
MSPQARRQSIIEAAADLILQTGHAGCSLEQIAEHAGISKALIYRYFPRREALLEAILEREFEALSGSGLDSVPDKVPVEEVIRATFERALRYYHDRGPILRLLASDPAVAELARAGNRASRSSATSYFVERLRKHYRLPKDVATIAVTMAVNAPIHSMTYLKRQRIDLDRTIDVWTEFMLGGWRALQERYGAPPRT